MSSLSLKHIYKVYSGGVRAVNDFCLEIKDKSFVVLVGPSGCGKSTTLRMIAGLEDITSGQLYIDDQLVNDVESKNRDIAMVFQSYALYPHMTVYQNMAFGLKLRHVKPNIIDEKVKAAAEILEISELLARKPKELSGGQRQRVALGRAIVREPNVFLLDEPLSNLDAKLRVQMRTEITKLHEKLQTTFIYVTHDQTEAMTMGDTIVVMKDGFIQQADSPITLFEDPTNLFVATFLGSPQMNIVECVLERADEKTICAILGNSNNNKIRLREETSKQIIASNIDISRPVLFGVRPDHIKISDNGTIDAVVEVVEQLGDETLVYTKIDGHDKYVTVKMPLTGGIKAGDNVKLEICLDRVYLFDKELEHSLVGVPSYNKLPCSLNNGTIIVGQNEGQLPCDFVSHLLDAAYENNKFIGFKPEYVSLEPNADSLMLSVKVEFVEERTKYNAVFAKTEGVDQYIVFRAPKDLKISKNQEVKVFISYEKCGIYSEAGDSLLSREEILRNSAQANVSYDAAKDETIVSIVGGEKLVYHGVKVDPGLYSLEIAQDKIKVLFNKKMAKALGKEFIAPTKSSLKFSAYDEEPGKHMNTIFGSIKGFGDYVTFVVDNNFSVYKMPKFSIDIPFEALKLS